MTEINLCWLESRGSEENKWHWLSIFQDVNTLYICSKNSFTFVQKCYTSMHGLQIHFQINFSSSQLDFWNPGSKYIWIRCYSCTPDSCHLFSFASFSRFYYQHPIGSQHLFYERIVCYKHTSLYKQECRHQGLVNSLDTVPHINKCNHRLLVPDLSPFCCCFETGSHDVTLADLELAM